LAEDKERYKKFAINKKAKQEYELLDRFEAGLVLTGTEVKVVRQGKVSIADAFVKVRSGELYIVGLHIAEYALKGYASHDPDRDKKLLLHKREILKLSSKIAEKGLTIIPLSIYPKDSYIKVELALARGKKTHDKREELKKRAVKRDMDRTFKIK
jgi:SsrA-binding protein